MIDNPVILCILLLAYFFAAGFFWYQLSLTQPWKAIFCFTVMPVFFVAAMINVAIVSKYVPWLVDTAETGRRRGERGGAGFLAALPLAFLATFLWYRLLRMISRSDGGGASSKRQADPRAKIRSRAVEQSGTGRMLFTTPTVNHSLPPLETEQEPADGDLLLAEDEWLQVEFLPMSSLGGVHKILHELKMFEAAHREGAGWKDTFVRKHHLADALFQTFTTDGIGAALGGVQACRLFVPAAVQKRAVRGGFCFHVAQGASIIGHAIDGKVVSLGAHLKAPSAFTDLQSILERLSHITPLVAVDWRTQGLMPQSVAGH